VEGEEPGTIALRVIDSNQFMAIGTPTRRASRGSCRSGTGGD
jgi:hypothetical protein